MELPPVVAARIERFLQEAEGSHDAHDDEAAMHGAIVLMHAVGMTWGLRPDGSFWMFDREFEVALEPLPADCETQALVWGARRFAWLSELLPVRASQAADCPACAGTGMLSVTWMCPRCDGLGWRRAGE